MHLHFWPTVLNCGPVILTTRPFTTRSTPIIGQLRVIAEEGVFQVLLSGGISCLISPARPGPAALQSLTAFPLPGQHQTIRLPASSSSGQLHRPLTSPAVRTRNVSARRLFKRWPEQRDHFLPSDARLAVETSDDRHMGPLDHRSGDNGLLFW